MYADDFGFRKHVSLFSEEQHGEKSRKPKNNQSELWKSYALCAELDCSVFGLFFRSDISP
jgi:hypothetical protein